MRHPPAPALSCARLTDSCVLLGSLCSNRAIASAAIVANPMSRYNDSVPIMLELMKANIYDFIVPTLEKVPSLSFLFVYSLGSACGLFMGSMCPCACHRPSRC